MLLNKERLVSFQKYTYLVKLRITLNFLSFLYKFYLNTFKSTRNPAFKFSAASLQPRQFQFSAPLNIHRRLSPPLQFIPTRPRPEREHQPLHLGLYLLAPGSILQGCSSIKPKAERSTRGISGRPSLPRRANTKRGAHPTVFCGIIKSATGTHYL